MADLEKQINDILLKYHHKGSGEPTLLEKGAIKADSYTLGVEILVHPNVKAFLNSLDTPANGKPQTDSTKLTAAIIDKWKTDKNFIKNLDTDLADPKIRAKLTQAIQNNPDMIAQNISNYKAGNLAAIIPDVDVSASASSGAKAEAKKDATAEAAKAKLHVNKQAVKAPVADTVSPAAAAAGMGLAPNEEVVTRSSSTKAPSSQPKQMSDEFKQGVFESLADRSDEEIANAIDADMVKSIAKGMAKDAVTKYGVPSVAANAFAKKIAGSDDPKDQAGFDPQLSENIATNLKRNPEFVRQLAKSSKDKTPLSKEMQDMAKGSMTSVMENPEDLTKDDYVKKLSRQMSSAQTMGGIGKMFSSLFGEGFGAKLSGWFGQIMETIKNFFSGFSGKPVLSMSTSGGSLLPNVLIHTKNFQENQDNAAAFARYKPEDMKALPIAGADGKIFHEVVSKNAKGEEVKKQEPNTITLKDADGKDVKVIPAVGNLGAKQIAGNFGADGKFIEGNIRVPVVTGIDKNGQSTSIATITMTPVEFNKYKTQVDAEAQKRGGQFTALEFENYTAEDAIKQGKGKGLQIISVNAASGAVSEPATVNPNLSRPPAVSNVGRNTPAVNDPEYALQSNG